MNVNLGKDVSEAKTASEAMEIAELDYKLHLEPVFLQGKQLVDDIPVIGKKVPEKFAVVREDSGEPISIVGNQYEVVQNSRCFGFFDGLVEQGLATFKRAYSTDGGCKVNIVADFGDMDIGGEQNRKRLTLRTSHDGSCKITGAFEVYRLVCSNGLMAWSKESSFAIKHTKSYSDKLIQAKKVIGIADQYYKWFANEAEKLIETPIAPQRAVEIIKQFVPAPDENKVSARVANQREAIFNYYQSGRGNSGKSAWDLYNGVAEYTDHWRSRNRPEEVQVETNLVGSGAKLKQKAFDVLSSLAV